MTTKLTLIRGLPGSGKSTLAKTYTDATHLEADMYFVDKHGDYRYEAPKVRLAHIWCQEETEAALARGENVVVSNTFVQRWEMKTYVTLAKRYNAILEVIECTGQYPNIHGVSQETIDQMKKRWQIWQNGQ